MNLRALGFGDWFSEHAGDRLQPGQSLARVMTVDRGAYLVRHEGGEVLAELSGKFRFAVESSPDLPCVGDWVCVEQASPTLAIIHAVLPRKTLLRRKCPGKTVDFQMIAVNLDVAFIVQSCHYDFNLRRLDRYLVMVNEGRIEPAVILSKTDLVTPEELGALIGKIKKTEIATQILPLSNTTATDWRNFVASSCPAERSACWGPPASARPASSTGCLVRRHLTRRPSAKREKAFTRQRAGNCLCSTTVPCWWTHRACASWVSSAQVAGSRTASRIFTSLPSTAAFPIARIRRSPVVPF